MDIRRVSSRSVLRAQLLYPGHGALGVSVGQKRPGQHAQQGRPRGRLSGRADLRHQEGLEAIEARCKTVRVAQDMFAFQMRDQRAGSPRDIVRGIGGDCLPQVPVHLGKIPRESIGAQIVQR